MNFNRTRLTVDSSRMAINGDISMPTADLRTVNMLLNSIVSTPNTNFLVVSFFLGRLVLVIKLKFPQYLMLYQNNSLA